MNTTQALENHYAAEGLRQRLDVALAEAGFATGPIDWKLLAQFDQFHTRGLVAVKELAELLNPHAMDKVLDLGSGFGGPARCLAATHGCDVTGIDLNELYVAISNDLSDRTGLADRTTFVQGDAANLPFDNESFEHAWTLHVSMNIQDKAAFYASVFRVLKPGGTFAIYDVVRGSGESVLYPAPWSPLEEFSFLATLSETQALVNAAGFITLQCDDKTAEAIEWLKQMPSSPNPSGPKQLNLPGVIGPHFGPMLKNMAQNFMEGRTRIVQGLFQKP